MMLFLLVSLLIYLTCIVKNLTYFGLINFLLFDSPTLVCPYERGFFFMFS